MNEPLHIIHQYPEIKPVMVWTTGRSYILENDMVQVEVSSIMPKHNTEAGFGINVLNEIAFLMQTIDHPKRNND